MSKLIKYTVVILATIAAAVLLYQFRVLLLLFLIAIAITATSQPLIAWLKQYRIPGFLAQLVILLLLGLSITGFILLAGPRLSAELQRLANYLLIQYNSAYLVWEAGPAWQQFLFTRLPEPGNLANYLIGSNGELILPAAINLTQNLAGFLSRLFIVLTFSLYWAQDHDRFQRLWLSILPVQQRIPVRSAWQTAEIAVGQYLRHELAMALLAAVLLGTGFALFGLPYPIALAVLAFVGWFIPLLGFAIILIPVFLTALGIGWGAILLTIPFTLLVLMGLKFWLEPKYLRTLRYSSFLIVFWIVVLGSFLGLGGYLAGPVIAVATQTIWEQYLQHRTRPEQVEIQIAELRERYLTAYERYRQIDSEYKTTQLGNIFERLELTLAQTEQLTEEHISGD